MSQSLEMGFSPNQGYHWGDPRMGYHDYSTLGSILGPLILGSDQISKVPFKKITLQDILLAKKLISAFLSTQKHWNTFS